MSKIANSFLFILKSQMTLSLGAWGGKNNLLTAPKSPKGDLKLQPSG